MMVARGTAKVSSSACIGDTGRKCITTNYPPVQKEAAAYFNEHKRDDVFLVRVELIGPDDGGVREPARSPVLPFNPLKARRRLDRDEDAG